MNDKDADGNYEWSSGVDITYTNWRVDAPNGTGSEDCVVMWPDTYHGYGGVWNHSGGCAATLHFVCSDH